VRDAEAHADEDSRRRDEAEVRNNADTLVYSTEKVLREQGDKLADDEKADIESKLADLKEALGGDDIDKIKDANEAVMVASQEFSQKLYEQASAADAAAAGGEATADAGDDDVVDAEIVEDEDQQ